MTRKLLRRTGGRWVVQLAVKESREAAAQRTEAMRKLAHDLRNPLNSVLLMAQLLEETGGTPDSVRIAGRIQRQCEEINRLLTKAFET